jgi:hypothetical protein
MNRLGILAVTAVSLLTLGAALPAGGHSVRKRPSRRQTSSA